MERRWWLQLEWTRLSLMGRSTSSAVFHILQTEESLLCLSFTNTRALELIYNHVWYKYGSKHEIPGSELWTEYSEMLPISQNWGSKFTPIGFQVFISVKPFFKLSKYFVSKFLSLVKSFADYPQFLDPAPKHANIADLKKYWVTLQCTSHWILLLFSWDLFGKCAFRYFELQRPAIVGESHK